MLHVSIQQTERLSVCSWSCPEKHLQTAVQLADCSTHGYYEQRSNDLCTSSSSCVGWRADQCWQWQITSDDVAVQCAARQAGARSWTHTVCLVRMEVSATCAELLSRFTSVTLCLSSLLALVTRRAVTFCIICSLCSSWLLTPANSLLQ